MSIAVKTADGWQVLGAGDGDCELVGGVAGWAAITQVSGTASLDDLKAANIAPDTADPDPDCEGTYNIVGDDGVVYRVAVFTGDGSITTSGGLVDYLAVGPGMYYSTSTAASTSGGRVSFGLLDLPAAEIDCTIGTKECKRVATILELICDAATMVN